VSAAGRRRSRDVGDVCAGGQVRDHDVRVVLRGVAECIEHSPVEEQRAECCAALVTIYSTAKYRSTGTPPHTYSLRFSALRAPCMRGRSTVHTQGR